MRRHLERARWQLDLTGEEGLAELATLCVTELVHAESGPVVARQVPEPNARLKPLLEALGLTPPTVAPEAKVEGGTRKKIVEERQALENKGRKGDLPAKKQWKLRFNSFLMLW